MVSSPANASAALAFTLVDELVRSGARELVLSPGSRSAPLAFAAHTAAASGRLRLHTRIDERSAGFLALGLAKTSRRPVVVVTTSGTAVANLHPAVLEASHAGVPLVVVTADRPAALRGTNANQTTDQVRIFGGAVRLFADIPPGAPGASAAGTAGHSPAEVRQVAGWRSLASRCAGTAQGAFGGPSGPVHLNVQLIEPLVPDVPDGWQHPCSGRPDGAPWMTAPDSLRPGVEPVHPDRRTVVVAGDDAGPRARIAAEVAGWPLLAEPSSGARTGPNAIRTYRLLLGDPALASRVEQVVVFGHPTLSRPVTALLGRGDIEVIAVLGTPGASGQQGWTDPGNQVSRVVSGIELPGKPRWSAEASGGRPRPAEPSAWLEEWLSRDADLSSRLDELVGAQPELTPHAVAHAVSAALPPRGLLVVGASNPIRDLDLMAADYPAGQRRRVLANRGLSGIDGTVSTAIGAALGRQDTSRAFALVGDITFLHDANGLVLGPAEPRPDLTIVVVNDDGGSIFSVLEQGGAPYSASFERLFGTPTGTDLGALCAATGTRHRRVTTLEELDAALAAPSGGVEVVEAVVRRDNRRDLDTAIRALVRS